MKRTLGWVLLAGLLGWTSAARAQADLEGGQPPLSAPVVGQILPAFESSGCDSNCSNLSDRDPFTAGSLTFQAMVGYFTRIHHVGPEGPALDYVPVGVRFGCILNTPERDDWLRGCGELLIEANYSRILRSFGTYIAGPDAILRYNFVQPDCLVVPYVQCGAGFVLNNAWQAPLSTQSLIGENFEFLLRAEVGTRIMITEAVSFDFEGGLQHVSNAGLAKRNGGSNNLGVNVGFSYFFGKIP